MFLLWCGDVLPKVYIFALRLVSGTGGGFGSAPQQKHTRYAQYRADKLDHAHWHICLPLKSLARPKQAKEPTFPDPRTKDQEILKKSPNSHKNRVG